MSETEQTGRYPTDPSALTTQQLWLGRGTKSLIGMIILSASILSSTFIMGMKIQKLIDGLMTVTRQHEAILDMKPCRQV